MSKKSTKVLSGALATSLALGAMPVFADTSVDYDALYAVANEAALKAQKEGTQEAITAARTAIKPLLDAYNAGEEWLAAMVGTLSSMVDEVQQKLFNDFYAMIYDVVDGKPVLKETLTQAEIDEARDYVLGFKTYEGNAEYINTWSAAVDAFQQKKYDAAYAAVEKAEKSQLQEDIDAAQKLMDELATSKNAEVAKWVTDVQAKLDAVEAIEVLKVESVSAISKTGVTLKIEALTEALTDVTVTVKDNKGNVVEVKPVAVLDVGETVATFTFKTALTANPAGEWTVNGVKFDADAQAAVKAVKDAGNQVELLNALKSSYFTSANADLIAKYDAEDFSNVVTVEDVQKIIDKVNKAEAGLDAAKAVREATNEVELLAALQDGGFERVNVDLITGYATYDGNADSTADYTVAATPAAVQAIVDAVNLKAAQDAVKAADTTVGTALTADAIAEAQELVSALPEKEVAEKTAKKALQDKIDVANAFAKVKGATTQASLLSALKAPVLKLQNIDDTLAKYYKAEFDKPTGKDAITSVTYTLQTTIVDAGKTAAIADYATKISEIDDETALADVKALLAELKRLDGTNFTEKINDALLEDYRTALDAEVAADRDTTTEINGILNTVNSPTAALTVLVDAGSALTDADKLLVALKAKTLNITVVDANKDAYFTDIALIKTAAGTDAKAVQKAVNVVNAVVDANAATTAEEMSVALTNHSANLATPNTAFLNLTAQAKLEVAAIVLKGRTADFADSSEVTAAVGATAAAGALKAHKDILDAVNGVNADSEITAIDTELQKVGYKAYNDLDLVDRLAVAEAFKNNLPRKDDGTAITLTYKTLADIIADIDAVL